MAQWNPNAYPRRVLLNQRQLAQLLTERRALNKWHAVGLFTSAMFGEDVRRLRFEQGSDQTRQVSAVDMEFKTLDLDLQTEFWHSITAANALYAAEPSATLVQDVMKEWVAILPITDDDWGRHDAPSLSYDGLIAIPQVMETENAYAETIEITLTEYQGLVDRFTTFFPKARIEPGLYKSIGYLHWQFRTGQISIEAVAERLNVFVFDLVQLWTKYDLEVYPEGAKGDYLISPQKLAQYLKEEIALYANDPTEIEYDDTTKSYSLWSAPRSARKHKHIFMQAQVKANRIIITIDHTDKPLFEALLHAGVPREQMVFAYQNNTRPLTYNIGESG